MIELIRLHIFGNVAAHQPHLALLHAGISLIERDFAIAQGLLTSLPTSMMPHSSVSITSYSWRADRFCAISRSLSCSRSGGGCFFAIYGVAVTDLRHS